MKPMMVAINDRIKKVRELGRDVNIKFELDKALELNALSLDNIREIKEMSHTVGWQMVANGIHRDIAQKERLIRELAIDPESNKTKLIINSTVVATWERLLGMIDGTLNQEPNVMKERMTLLKQKE